MTSKYFGIDAKNASDLDLGLGDNYNVVIFDNDNNIKATDHLCAGDIVEYLMKTYDMANIFYLHYRRNKGLFSKFIF